MKVAEELLDLPILLRSSNMPSAALFWPPAAEAQRHVNDLIRIRYT